MVTSFKESALVFLIARRCRSIREDDDRKDYVTRCCPKGSCSDRCEESVAEICFVQLGKTSRPRGEKPRLSNMSVFVRGVRLCLSFWIACASLVFGFLFRSTSSSSSSSSCSIGNNSNSSITNNSTIFCSSARSRNPIASSTTRSATKSSSRSTRSRNSIARSTAKSSSRSNSGSSNNNQQQHRQ